MFWLPLLAKWYVPLSPMKPIMYTVQVACLVRVPTEVVKTRMQTLAYGPQGHSSWSAAKLVLSNDGWRGFYRGFGITIMREVSS